MKPEIERPIELPEGAKIIRTSSGDVIGVAILGDGSWDMTVDGQDFLSGKRPIREGKKNENNK